ncbi:MAG: Glutamate carboxypeptidase [Limosilactobacillus fermentum]
MKIVSKKILYKDAWQSIGRSPGRFIALVLLMLLGTFSFVGLKITGPDMRQTGLNYFNQTHLADMTVTSAYGLNQAAQKTIADQARVKTVNYGYFTDAKIKGSTNGIRVFSNSGSLSQYKVVAGRLAKTDTEIALNNTLKGTYHLGETITLQDGTGLAKTKFKVVGFVESAEFINHNDFGQTSVGTGQLSGFGVTTKRAFSLTEYNLARISYRDTAKLNAYSNAYTKLMNKRQATLLKDLNQHRAAKYQAAKASLSTALINQDTNALDAASVDATLTLVEDFLTSHGLTAVREQSTTANPVLVADLNETAPSAPLILLGHLDTIFSVGTAKQRPGVIDGERLTGPGSNDMKPSAVMAIATLLALKEANYQAHPVRLILVTDEEILHKNAPTKETIARLSKGAVAGFNFESADPDNGVVTGRKGGAIVDLTVTGIAAHSGKEPEKGRSAVLELAHQIIKAEALTDQAAGKLVNCGLVSGGTSENIIPDHAHTGIAVRFTTKQQGDELLAALQEQAAHPTVTGTTVEMKVATKIDSMDTLPGTAALLEKLQASARLLHQPVPHGKQTGGASDAGVLTAHNIPTLCGLGIMGGGAHTAHEYGLVSSMFDRAALVATTIAHLD